MKEGLKDCDIVMMLRIQKERIVGKLCQMKNYILIQYGLRL